jgi:hypothetical protein
MTGLLMCCPHCGHTDLDPRRITIGVKDEHTDKITYQEIITLKCQHCGWLGEQSAEKTSG